MVPVGHALAQPQLESIAEACRPHQVLRMHLFGSALRDDFDPTHSKLDLLVGFQPIEPGALVQAYVGLERQLVSITGLEPRLEESQSRNRRTGRFALLHCP